jgi:uncharacterized protein
MTPLEKTDSVPSTESGATLVDCDIHPALTSIDTLATYMPKRWRNHLRDYGIRARDPLGGRLYPPISPALSRLDTWPSNGPPGSDLELMRAQHLDALGIEIGILQPLSPAGREERNPDFAIEICRAMNEWQAAEWTAPEPRLRSSICVPAEDAEASVGEIERLAGRTEFAQVFMQPRLREPLGSRRYWPIYEAAVHHGFPVGLHVGGNIGIPITPSGWPSSYGENHFAHSVGMQAAIANLVIEGVFERVPDLKIVVVEAGFAWVPAVSRQMDYFWSRLRSEVPHLKRPPSEYVRRNIWFTTQPMDEPERPRDIVDIFEWIGWDRLMFASDYPHWDSDHPRLAFPQSVPRDRLQAILSANARGIYRLS